MSDHPRLSDAEAQQAQPRTKPYKLYDSGGLCLFISPHGTKSFRYNYRFNDKRQTLTIGKYPVISLEEARARHVAAKRDLSQGIDPAREKRAEKEALRRVERKIAQKGAPDHRFVTTKEVLLILQLEKIARACKTARSQLGDI